jgi:TetR/AcrR family transcriptional repressor of nem operon
MVGWLSSRVDKGPRQKRREDQALATLSSLVGALVLARAVNDPKLSDDILRATRNGLGLGG